jgi:hypothetical protein
LAAFYSDRLVEGTLDWTTATLAKWIEIFFEAKLFQVAIFYSYYRHIFYRLQPGRAVLAVEYLAD